MSTNSREASCQHCTDPDGVSCFPQYGIGPHEHAHDSAGNVLPGRTVVLPREQWPTNYREDPEWPGMGVWWCPHCGSGKPDEVAASIREAGKE